MSSCLFCEIIGGSIPAKKVFEDDQILAFYDINPKAKTHILIIPKKHIESGLTAQEEDESVLGHLILVAKKIAQEQNLEGYKLLMNVGKKGGQVIFHVHLHLLAGGKIDLESC